ncbi:hypothetical protein [Rufibacter immobilis]|uniref:hypothetical protein n=1 Tax=Rufibacter immobilis TaxID=1348778 RepID=UPI0035E4F532
MKSKKQHFRLEKCRITEEFIEAYFNCRKELRLLISQYDLSVYLSPAENYEVCHEHMTNSKGEYTSQILFDGFRNTTIGTRKQEKYFRELRGNLKNDIGQKIVIIHDSDKSYYQYRTGEGTYNIEASESLTKILQTCKTPIMSVKGNLNSIPRTRKSHNCRKGAKTILRVNALRVINEENNQEKEFPVDIEIQGNYLEEGDLFNHLKITSDFFYVDAGLKVNLKNAHIKYTKDHYDGVFRGEIVKKCIKQEWRKFKIKDLLGPIINSGSI